MKKLFLIVMLAVITALSLNAVVGCKKKKVDSASDSTSMMIDDSVKFVGGSESAQQSEETSLKGSESVTAGRGFVKRKRRKRRAISRGFFSVERIGFRIGFKVEGI